MTFYRLRLLTGGALFGCVVAGLVTAWLPYKTWYQIVGALIGLVICAYLTRKRTP